MEYNFRMATGTGPETTREHQDIADQGVNYPEVGKSKIMIVEENKIARMVLQNEFSDMDVDLLLVSTAEEAISLADKEQPAVITMQVEFPGMNGLEICRRLKNNYRTKSIPVIFVAQNDIENEQREAFASGAVDYCVTPFPKGKLAAKVQRILEYKAKEEPQTILVAEDSETIRSIIVGILRKQGHSVIEASDGMEAWNKLQKYKNIDIIISDIIDICINNAIMDAQGGKPLCVHAVPLT